MTKKRTIVILAVLLVAISVLIYRAGMLTIGDDNRLRANLVVMNRTPISVKKLTEHVDYLQSMMNNIDSFRLIDIRDALQKTVTLVRESSMEYKAQYDAWMAVRDEISKDKNSFLKLRQQLDQTQKLQSEEVVRLKKALDEVNRPSLYADMLNLSLSFVLGVLSSILATKIISWWSTRKPGKSIQD